MSKGTELLEWVTRAAPVTEYDKAYRAIAYAASMGQMTVVVTREAWNALLTRHVVNRDIIGRQMLYVICLPHDGVTVLRSYA